MSENNVLAQGIFVEREEGSNCDSKVLAPAIINFMRLGSMG